MSEREVNAVSRIVVNLSQQEDYRFDITFGQDIAVLVADEPAPLGSGKGPSPVQLLAAAVGSCLSDSLLFSLRKFKQRPEPLRCEVEAAVGRNPEGRLRVVGMKVVLTLGTQAAQLEHLERAVEQFEQFCTVSQSVGQGIPIDVEVHDAAGVRVK